MHLVHGIAITTNLSSYPNLLNLVVLILMSASLFCIVSGKNIIYSLAIQSSRPLDFLLYFPQVRTHFPQHLFNSW